MVNVLGKEDLTETVRERKIEEKQSLTGCQWPEIEGFGAKESISSSLLCLQSILRQSELDTQSTTTSKRKTFRTEVKNREKKKRGNPVDILACGSPKSENFLVGFPRNRR